MSARYLGSLTLASALPFAAQAQAKLDVAIGVSLPEIQAKIAGALEAQARLTATPPSLVANLQLAQDLVIAIQAAIAVGVPDVDFQLDFLAGVIAELQAQAASLEADAAFSASLLGLLGTAGVHMIAFTGNPATAGAELQSVIDSAGLGANAGGILLIASATAPRIALGTFCGVEIST